MAYGPRSAEIYDAIYRAAGKDYDAEVARLRTLMDQFNSSKGRSLLDVACGTGGHLGRLRSEFEVEGLDIDEAMLAVARARCPDVPLHQADMVDFELDRRFDVILCLFSSIGFVRTRQRLNQAIATMARHLEPGGVLFVEPWITPDAWEEGRLDAVYVDEPDLKVARINSTTREGNISRIHFHYLVGTHDGIEHFNEEHELGLFPHETYREAFEQAGLHVEYDPEGLMDRGLFVGVSPLHGGA